MRVNVGEYVGQIGRVQKTNPTSLTVQLRLESGETKWFLSKGFAEA